MERRWRHLLIHEQKQGGEDFVSWEAAGFARTPLCRWCHLLVHKPTEVGGKGIV